ncbi:hypothetical protein SB778_00935 [Paraburkholderia sp. SIMBA_050]
MLKLVFVLVAVSNAVSAHRASDRHLPKRMCPKEDARHDQTYCLVD